MTPSVAWAGRDRGAAHATAAGAGKRPRPAVSQRAGRQSQSTPHIEIRPPDARFAALWVQQCISNRADFVVRWGLGQLSFATITQATRCSAIWTCKCDAILGSATALLEALPRQLPQPSSGVLNSVSWRAACHRQRIGLSACFLAPVRPVLMPHASIVAGCRP